jgi:hypothetical protein
MTSLSALRLAFAVGLVAATLAACGDDGGGSKSSPSTGGADAGVTGGSGGASGSAGATSTGGSAGTTSTGGSAGAATCLEELDQLGVAYENTVAKGVVDAVHLKDKLNGLLIASEDTNTLSGDPMACEFVLHLWKLADVLATHGIHKIGTLGSYCYRCCCYWSQENYCRGPNDPEPDCTQAPWSGYSNHSWGRAIDIRWLYKDSGEVFDVNDPAQFVKWSNSSQTCTAALQAQSGISQELYSIACELSSQKVFGTILTPNYNDAHRDHFHCDIGKSGEPSSFIVKSLESSVDQGPGDD